jgi:two-component system C4-dicarboxylate transport sensor histidine kinase DctB
MLPGRLYPVAQVRDRFVPHWLGQRLSTCQRWFGNAWVLLVIAAGVCLSYSYTEQLGIETIRAAAVHRVDIYETALESELARYTYLPPLLNLNPDVVSFLRKPDDAVLANKVDRYLAAVNQEAHSNTLHIMDVQGNTLASSNWDEPDSFVGMNFRYRPYFQQALEKGSGWFYGLGAATKKAGYFYAERIYADGKVVGIAAVKISLDKIERIWRHAGDTAMISDAYGVIFLTTCDSWRFKSLDVLSSDVRAKIIALHQYDAPGALQAIGLVRQGPEGDSANIGAFARDANLGPHPPAFLTSRFLLLSRPMSSTGWTISTMSDIRPAEIAALNVALGVGMGMTLVAVFAMYLLQRRRIIEQELAAKENLHRMNAELERKVTRRTGALSRINKTLKVEIAERRRAEAVLKSTLQELVQAGKMAALGQMSASITHELNQPLAALRTLSSNALMFMQRRELDEAQENLRVICDLTERLGKITSQLKRFARKSSSCLDRVLIRSAISNAIFLLDGRIRKGNVELLRIEPHADLYGIAEQNRLEQVLINLIGNALDAMAEADSEHGARTHVLTISVHCEADHVSIYVRDTGTGISDRVRAHLFEPFFTTKDQGEGLGLGLTISASIIQEFGGTLAAHNRSDGAEFIVKLKQVPLRGNDVQ